MPWSLLFNKYVVFGFILLSLGVALMVQTARVESANKAQAAAELVAKQWEANFKTAQEVNGENLKALELIKTDNARMLAIFDAQVAKYNRLGKIYEDLKKAAYNDKTALSPSWVALFDGLRSIETSARGDNQDTGRTPSHP